MRDLFTEPEREKEARQEETPARDDTKPCELCAAFTINQEPDQVNAPATTSSGFGRCAYLPHWHQPSKNFGCHLQPSRFAARAASGKGGRDA